MMRNYFARMILTAMVLFSAGCGNAALGPDGKPKAGQGTDEANKKTPELIIPVEATLPYRGRISEYKQLYQNITANERVDVTSQGVGVCTMVGAEEGDLVERGQVLAELEKEESLATMRQNEVQLRQRKAEMERARQGAKDGIVSAADYDTARFAYESALATLEAQKVQLEKLTIRAPISGVVTIRAVQMGMLVTSGSPVFSIYNPNSLQLEVFPTENDLPRLYTGQEALVSLEALPDETLTAQIDRINPESDPTSGTVKVTLAFNPADRSRLREGSLAQVSLIMDTHENALLIEKGALVEEQGRKYVYVVGEEVERAAIDAGAEKGGEKEVEGDDADVTKEDSAEKAPLIDPEETGPVYKVGRVEIVTGYEEEYLLEVLEGISDTDKIVTLGQQALKDGTLVKVTHLASELDGIERLSAEEALAKAKERGKAKNDGSQMTGGRRGRMH